MGLGLGPAGRGGVGRGAALRSPCYGRPRPDTPRLPRHPAMLRASADQPRVGHAGSCGAARTLFVMPAGAEAKKAKGGASRGKAESRRNGDNIESGRAEECRGAGSAARTSRQGPRPPRPRGLGFGSDRVTRPGVTLRHFPSAEARGYPRPSLCLCPRCTVPAAPPASGRVRPTPLALARSGADCGNYRQFGSRSHNVPVNINVCHFCAKKIP